MPDFETHPIGTADRLKALEAENARLREALTRRPKMATDDELRALAKTIWDCSADRTDVEDILLRALAGYTKHIEAAPAPSLAARIRAAVERGASDAEIEAIAKGEG
jgi:hypothetical protein